MFTLHILLAGLIITLVITSMGFKKTVWFISIGYTFSIAVLCALFMLFHYSFFQLHNFLQNILLLGWACRLGYFLVKREANEQYNSSVQDQTGTAQGLPLVAKIGIWVAVSVLYICMFSPIVFATQKSDGSNALKLVSIIAGLAISFLGIIIEAVADKQKAEFKKLHPQNYCTTGLYNWVRCPNYLGEIMVWLGNFICALVFLLFWWQWLIAATGLICIVLIMMGSAKRLEKKQLARYGNEEAYQQYCKEVPILFPWVPLYSLQRIKVYLE